MQPLSYRRRFVLRSALIAIPVLLASGIALVATRSSDEPKLTVKSFASQLSYGAEALRSEIPDLKRENLETKGVTVEGTISGIEGGITYNYGDAAINERRCCNRYATIVIDVDRVIAGKGELVARGKVYAQVIRSALVPLAELRAALPDNTRAVATLSPIAQAAADTPSPRSPLIVNPATMPADATPLWATLWAQGPNDDIMTGLTIDKEELPASYGHPQTLDDLVAHFERVLAT